MDNVIKSEYVSKEFCSFFRSYVASAKVSDATVREYAGYIKLLCNACGCDFLEITDAMALKYMDKLRDKASKGHLSVQTIRVRFVCYRAIASYLKDVLGVIEENPFMLVQIPECSTAPFSSRIPELDECNLMLDTALSLYGRGLHLIFTLVLRMGLTVGEVCTLRKQYIIIREDRMMLCFPPKTPLGEARVLTVPRDVATIISGYVAGMALTDYLFVNQRGNPLSVHRLEARVRKVVEACGLTECGYTLKDLRNRAIYQMLYDGAQAVDVQAYVSITEQRMGAFVNSAFADSQRLNNCPAELSRIRVVAVS